MSNNVTSATATQSSMVPDGFAVDENGLGSGENSQVSTSSLGTTTRNIDLSTSTATKSGQLFNATESTSLSIINNSSTEAPTQVLLSSTIPNDTTYIASSTIQLEYTTIDNTILLGLELWHLIVIGAAIILFIVLIIVALCCICKKRKKRSENFKKSTMEDMWAVNTGGVDMPMISVASQQKSWKESSNSVDKVTSPDEDNSVTVNVFAAQDEDESEETNKIDQQNSDRSHSPDGSVKRQSSEQEKPKTKKSLTKVEMPKINLNQNSMNEDNATARSPDAVSEKSELNSVFEDNPATPKVTTLKSEKSQSSSLTRSIKKSNSIKPKQSESSIYENLPPAPPAPPADVA